MKSKWPVSMTRCPVSARNKTTYFAPQIQLFLGLNMSLAGIKSTDVVTMKTLKSPPGSVKLAFGAMCIILGIGPERISEAQAKKNVNPRKKWAALNPHIYLPRTKKI
jgi:hypothetical protein